MKRRLVRICVLLILGAIVNVAVAWGLALSGGIGPQRYMPGRIFPDARGPMLANWGKYRPDEFHVVANGGFELDHVGFVSASLHAESEQAIVMIAGLPSPSLIGYRFERFDDVNAGWRVAADTFVRLPISAEMRLPNSGASDYEKTWLPVCPIWPGFAINTVFYAGIFWMLFAAPFALRQRSRRRRGLCVKCGYDLRGAGSPSGACPECGAPIGPRAEGLS